MNPRKTMCEAGGPAKGFRDRLIRSALVFLMPVAALALETRCDFDLSSGDRPARASVAIFLLTPLSGRAAGGSSLRTQTETIRSAHLIRAAVIETNRFRRVFVLPGSLNCIDGFAAEVCLVARLAKAAPDRLSIAWRLSDASGEVWINRERRAEQRIRGLRGRQPDEDRDFFDQVYCEIAEEISQVLDRRLQSGERPMSELELMRKLKLARHFQPGLYQDALLREPKQAWHIQQWPDMSSEDWQLHIEALAAADTNTNLLMTERYAQFAGETHLQYQNWQLGKLDSAGLQEKLAGPLSKLRQDIDLLTALRDGQYERFRLILRSRQ